MTRSVFGWGFVAVQAVLLGAIVVLPSASHWPTPAWVDAGAVVVLCVGILIVAVAAVGLGSSLTATPVPVRHGELATDGLYRWVRHPIYSGVLLAVVAVAARSGNAAAAAVAAATVAFFHIKARWEETQLALRYPDYPEYAARTPRFVPRWRRSVS